MSVSTIPVGIQTAGRRGDRPEPAGTGWIAGRLRWEAQLRRLEHAYEAGAGIGLERPSPDTDAAIEVVGLCAAYGSRSVLHGVDLRVATGEVCCLLGPNGAGKTTTVEILQGFLAPTAGEVRVLGLDPRTQPAGLRERVGVVAQQSGFPTHLRVAEMLDAWRAYYVAPRPLDELLDVVELQAERDTLIGRLSGGQQRRLDLALALAGGPDLVFLDEPTTGFDPDARQRCWDAINNLRDLGTTILLTTHYLDEAERLADRVAVLVDGRIAACGPPRELAASTGSPARIAFRAPPPVARGDLDLPDGFALDAATGTAHGIAPDAWEATVRLQRWAEDHGLPSIDDLTVAPPGLEDAYRHYTGTPS